TTRHQQRLLDRLPATPRRYEKARHQQHRLERQILLHRNHRLHPLRLPRLLHLLRPRR
ncbi:hypothetical protein HK102_007344, partial [Quaeritorhiza haematococci]